MTHEELAFVNHQLAGMLASGLPLEGALRRLCEDMRRGRLRTELEALAADLARGAPLAEALRARQLPELYGRMIQFGARANDLPGALTLVADYYQRAHLVGTRLKGLLVYPLIVLLASVALAAFLAAMFKAMLADDSSLGELPVPAAGAADVSRLVLQMWAPPIGLGLIALAALTAVLVPGIRRRLRWQLPAFRESALSQLASTLHLMLAKGGALTEAVALARQLEAGSPAGVELERWGQRLAQGLGKPSEFAAGGRVFPPLFLWLVAQGGEDLAGGFKRAAEVYYARAIYRIELLLYLALPVSVMMLGFLLVTQFYPVVRVVAGYLDLLGDLSGI
jgi:type II secretory pathway component PulF